MTSMLDHSILSFRLAQPKDISSGTIRKVRIRAPQRRPRAFHKYLAIRRSRQMVFVMSSALLSWQTVNNQGLDHLVNSDGFEAREV